MIRLYRSLLFLYPPAHREQFGDEMMEVLREVEADNANQTACAHGIFCAREAAGLLVGALQEHWRALGLPCPTFPVRRFTMHTEFRFPKSTAVLMTIILAGIVLAIEKGEGIVASLNAEPHFNFLPSVALVLVSVYAAGALGWVILFALRRSGVHRLESSAEQK